MDQRISPGQFNLYHFPEQLIVEPLAEKRGHLQINRYEAEENYLRISTSPIQINQANKIEQINGIIGIIELISGPYLIVIKSASSVGILNDAEIFRVLETDLIPFKRDLHLDENDKRKNRALVDMLQNVLTTDAFYYSTSIDISRTFQWLSENSNPDSHQESLLKRVDQCFIWNYKLCEKFDEPELSKFVHPLIHGFVAIRACSINNIPFKLALISRRSVDRAGIRLHTRGADAEGNCANFVETEQVLEYEQTIDSPSQGKQMIRHISSFIQIRASIPLFWTQKPNLTWKPKLALRSLDEQCSCFKFHLTKLNERYGREALNGLPRKIVFVNLINQYGQEHALGVQLREVVEKMKRPNIKYIAFDFHRHCQSLNWDRLSLLKSQLDPDIREFGFFYTRLVRHNKLWIDTNAETNTRLHQNGFFRTNCMDCLDRTNVVQALIAMESLRLQLHYFGIIPGKANNFNQWPEFIYVFKNLWADNGDDCSKQYAGTGALKTDYTRIGKRTFGGAMQDLNNSLIRYFKNNFADGFRLDAINLFLGNYTVRKEAKEGVPERVDHSLINFDTNGAAIAGAVFSGAMTLLCAFSVSGENSFKMLPIFWFAIFAAFTGFIWVNGDDFIDKPQLLPATPIINVRSQHKLRKEDVQQSEQKKN